MDGVVICYRCTNCIADAHVFSTTGFSGPDCISLFTVHHRHVATLFLSAAFNNKQVME